MQWQYRVTTVILPLLALTSVAQAEVADKLPMATHIWFYAGPLALIVFLCAHFKPAIGVVAILFTFYLNPGCGVWEINHDLQGVVVREMGVDYLHNAYLAIATPPIFGLLGLVSHFIFRRRRGKDQPENSDSHHFSC